VDDAVEAVVASLEALPARDPAAGYSSALDETFIFYTADNG